MKKLYLPAILILLVFQLSAQDPGDLVAEFGTNGISSHTEPNEPWIGDIAVTADGKILATGDTRILPGDMAILAYLFNSDGTLAPFAGGSWLEFQLGRDVEVSNACYVLPDGKMLISGYFYNTLDQVYFFVMRLLPDGSLDLSFGVDGIATNLAWFFRPTSISVHYGLSGDYSIYAGGYTNESGFSPAIVKLYNNGEIATSFGTDGMYILPLSGGLISDIYAYSFAGSGYLLAGGHQTDGEQFFISKHNLITGELASDFATDGMYYSSIPTGNDIYSSSLVFESSIVSNTITIFGDFMHVEADMDIFAVRLNASDGTPDVGFGVNGYSSLRAPGSDEEMYDAILQPTDKKYYFGGRSNIEDISDFMIGRMTSSGFLDLSFGDNGIVLTDIYNSDYLRGLALSPDHTRLYAGGNSYTATYQQANLACYHTGVGVGIPSEEPHEANLNIYPNPASGSINLETDVSGVYMIEIYSPGGSKKIMKTLEGSSIQLNIAHLAPGLYFLKLSGDKNTYTTKFIKQ